MKPNFKCLYQTFLIVFQIIFFIFKTSFCFSIENNSIIAKEEINSSVENQEDLTSLEYYLGIAQQNNLELLSLYERYKASQKDVIVSKYLPDPKISYSKFIEKVQTRTGAQSSTLSITQKFPWFGKLDTQEKISLLNVEMNWWYYERARLDLIRKVTQTYYDYIELKENINLLHQNLNLLKNIEPIIQKRVQGGQNQNDILRLQMEISKHENKIFTLERKKKPLKINFNFLLGQTEIISINSPKNIPNQSLKVIPKNSLKQTTNQNIEIRILSTLLEIQKLKIKLSKLESKPILGFNINYIQTDDSLNENISGSGKDPFSIGLAASIPIWTNKNNAQIENASLLKSSIEKKLNHTKLNLTHQHAQILFELEDSNRQILLYKDVLIPRALQNLKLNEVAYQTNKSSLLDIIDSQRNLIEFELLFIQSIVRHQKQIANLHWIQGEQINENLS